MSIESQKSITDWADQTFGLVSDPLQSALRADQEMKEFRGRLNEALGEGAGEALRDYFSDLCSEAADIVICLYHMASVMGADLGQEIDQKMRVNRQRQWVSDGTGHGQHVRQEQNPDWVKLSCNHMFRLSTMTRVADGNCPVCDELRR